MRYGAPAPQPSIGTSFYTEREEPTVTESHDECPCGCKGQFDQHDDRSYGYWACPRCGEDSDRDLGLPCFECETHVDLRLQRSQEWAIGILPVLKIRIETDEYIYEEYTEA